MADVTWRVIAQRITTGDFLSWDLPLSGATHSRELGGPGGVNGQIAPELRHAIADDGRPLLEEWTTALYIEESGSIRHGGIVQSLSAEGSTLSVTAPGFMSYPTGVPIITDYLPEDFEDPVAAFRNLLAHLQAFPDGDIGLTVDAGASTYMVLSNGAGPYTIAGSEYRDYGNELNNIALATPFDFTETHEWNGAHTAIDHSIKIGFPRLGGRRFDLRFAQGENIIGFSPVGADGAKFSNEVHVLGDNPGVGSPRAVSAVRDGRLRRPVVVTKKVDTDALAKVYADQERRTRELKVDIGEVQVREHPNAPLAAIQPGDDVYTEVEVPWFGEVAMWLRVLSVEQSIDQPGRATLKTQRSEAFAYASATNPSADGSPIVVTI